MRRALIPLLLVAAVLGYVVWQRPEPPAPKPAPPKDVVLQYSDGSRMWSSSENGRSPLVKRVLAELAEASVSYDSLAADGGVVRTTIDAKAQTVAAAALGRLIAPVRELDGAMTAIDPASGGVRVYLSGLRYGDDSAGEVRREPGSGLVLAGAENVVQARVTPLEVSATYATFAAGGVERKPHFVEEVRAADGATRYRAAGASKPVFGKELSDQLTARLKENPACNGIACAPSAYVSPEKPGTTQHAWMAAYTPQFAVAVLVRQADDRFGDLPTAALDTTTPGAVLREFLAG